MIENTASDLLTAQYLKNWSAKIRLFLFKSKMHSKKV